VILFNLSPDILFDLFLRYAALYIGLLNDELLFNLTEFLCADFYDFCDDYYVF
jgi:hypothetical protein